MAEGDTRIALKGHDLHVVKKDFVVDDAMLQAFRQHCIGLKMKIDEAAFAKDTEFIKAMIHYDIDLALFGGSEARRNILPRDPQAQLALQSFGQAEALMNASRARNAKAGH